MPNGLEALAIQRATPVDIILTDCWMPEMDGPHLVAEIRKAEAEAGLEPVPVFAVTADVEIVKNAAASGFTGVLLKPVTLNNLVKVLAGMA